MNNARIKKTGEIKAFYPVRESGYDGYIDARGKFYYPSELDFANNGVLTLYLNPRRSSVEQYKEFAEQLLKIESLLDDTSTVPHVQLRRSQKYLECYLVDALYKGDDGKLYWYVTYDYDMASESIDSLEFDMLPTYLIHSCLDEITRTYEKENR